MSEGVKREVYGYTHNGNRVFLGRATITDDEALGLLDLIAGAYKDGSKGYFNIRSSVFSIQAFAGVQINPPITAHDE